jgi:thiol:disulfide interchange protein
MKPIFRTAFALCLCAAIPTFPGPGRAADENKDAPIYDESADGARQINEALAIAAREHKRVLLQFGANWCVWCHRLHHTFETNPEVAAVLKERYVVVLIDVNAGHHQATDEKYGQPTRLGLPVLVVLDAGGKQLTTDDSGKLEEGDHHSPSKILTFLKADPGHS